ncbi:peroxidase-related enzyme [Tunturibacter psychrotolerans]|uniref:Peroxidase-related enzyme n=1 Tax=Tunturiibacter psychrotolerans TaxID=3069686 RepID=A0AAU7ZNS8_9BACT
MTTIATIIPIVEEDAATGAVAEAYADYRTRFERDHIPSILKCFATHPPLLEQMIALASTLLFTESHLSRKIKEMIATYISALNACPYCLDSHASFLRTQGGSNELLQALSNANLDSPSLTLRESRMLDFVGKVTIESHRISPDDINLMKSVGWAQQEIAEAVHITALFACFNRVANTFGLPSQNLLDHGPNLVHAREKA